MPAHVHATMSAPVTVPGVGAGAGNSPSTRSTLPLPFPAGTRALDIYAWVGAHAWHARACRDDTLAQHAGSRTESNSYVYTCVCRRRVVSQCSVVAAGRSAGSSNGSSDGSVWRSPGIDPGTTASSSSPQRPTQPGPSTPEALGGRPPSRHLSPSPPPPPCRTAPVRAIALWSSSLSACTNKACIQSVRVCKGLKRTCGTVWKWKRMTSKGAREDAVPKKARILSDVSLV